MNYPIAECSARNWGGVSSARNIGLENSHGEWVCFIDADDRIMPNHVDLLMRGITDAVDVVEGGFIQVDINGRQNTIEYPETTVILSLNDAGCYQTYCMNEVEKVGNAPWNKLFRREFLVKEKLLFDTRFTMNEDRIFAMQAFLKARGWQFIPMTGYVYRATYGSAMSRYHDQVEESWRTYLDIKDEIKKKNGLSLSQINREKTNMQFYLAWQYIWNMFKPGCPMSLSEKRTIVKKLINEKAFLQSCDNRDRNRERLRYKLFYYCSKTGNSMLVILLFYAQHHGKQIINSIYNFYNKI